MVNKLGTPLRFGQAGEKRPVTKSLDNVVDSYLLSVVGNLIRVEIRANTNELRGYVFWIVCLAQQAR